MPELLTPRLRCSPLQLDDWSFFLSLQQDPQVMLYVADPRPQAAIREAFDSRLPPWTPGDEHWLCLVVRDRLTHTPLGLTGYQHHQRDIAEVGFLFARRRRVGATATNRCARCATTPLPPAASAA